MKNVYDDPAYREVEDSLTIQLRALQKKFGDSDSLAQKFLEHDKNKFKIFRNVY